MADSKIQNSKLLTTSDLESAVFAPKPMVSTKWQDVWMLGIYIFGFLIFCVLAVKNAIFVPNAKQAGTQISDLQVWAISQHLLIPISLILTLFLSAVLFRFTSFMAYFGMLFLSALLFGLAGISYHFDYLFQTALLGIFGAFLFFIFSFLGSGRSLTSSLISKAIELLRQNKILFIGPAVSFVGLFVFVAILSCSIFGSLELQLVELLSGDVDHDALISVATQTYCIYFFLWSSSILQSLTFYITSRYLFYRSRDRSDLGSITNSLKCALSYNFGSICLGSLLSNYSKKYPLLSIAIHNNSFFEARKKIADIFKKPVIKYMIEWNSSKTIISSFSSFTAVTAVAIGMAGIHGMRESISTNPGLFIISFIIADSICYSLLCIIEAVIVSVIICLAEDPKSSDGEIRRIYDELHQELIGMN